MPSVKIKMQRSDRIYMAVVYFFLGIITITVCYPLIYIISASFSSAEALVQGKVILWPVNPSLMGYITVFKTTQVWIGFFNSIVYAACFVVLQVLVSMMAAFPLSRNEFPAKKVMTWMFSITMFISGGMIPNYLLIKNLGMMDSMWSLILPAVISAWNIIICRTFIKGTIPEELFEATCIDGGSYFHFFFKMVLPLSKPIMAVMALAAATSMWNSYMSALLYITDPNKFPLQIVLRNILIQNQVDYSAINLINVRQMIQRQYLSELLKYSLIVISSVPLLVLYPFIQKYFIKGVMIGSIKG